MMKLVVLDPCKTDHLRTHPTLKGLNENVFQILGKRGVTSESEVERFMFGGLKDLHDPRLMKDADLATDIMIKHVRRGDIIVVYGDYDCDGVGSTYEMTHLLRKAGGKVYFFVNNRFKHGYGMSPSGIDDLLALYPDVKLIVTVDNGISAHAGVDYAKEKGICVVVTDHHDQAATLPNADAVVDPKRHDCEYPFKGLCGAGVAFKLMTLMYWKMGLPLETVYEFLDIVALTTIADVVPLVDENRVMTRLGLERMRKEDRMAFRIFRQVTGAKKINSHTIGMIYAPMVNAIGRLVGDVTRAIEMFFEENEEVVLETVEYLRAVNEERKKITAEQTQQAIEMIEGKLNEDTGKYEGGKGLKHVIVVYDKDFHEGVVGLIAGRLKEQYNRPVFAFTDHHGIAKGSGRGIDGFHLKKAMDEIPQLLKGYGGHAKACGLSLDQINLEAFEEEMNRMAEASLTEADFVKVHKIDLVLTPSDVTLEFVEDLESLEPFGEGFAKPVLALRDFVADKAFAVPSSTDKTHAMYMGSEKQHLKLKCGKLDLIMWSGAKMYHDLGEPQCIKALGYPDLNVYNNKVTVQFMISDGLMFPQRQAPVSNAS